MLIQFSHIGAGNVIPFFPSNLVLEFVCSLVKVNTGFLTTGQTTYWKFQELWVTDHDVTEDNLHGRMITEIQRPRCPPSKQLPVGAYTILVSPKNSGARSCRGLPLNPHNKLMAIPMIFRCISNDLPVECPGVSTVCQRGPRP